MKDENVNFEALESKEYAEGTFYVCPICGGEYLDTFVTEKDGEVMCIDCWSSRKY